jgi:hypothetical protein
MHLVRLQLLAMFFPELFPTRPILAMIGPKGSGKTSVLELIGTLFFGDKFRVADLTDDPRDFDAALTSDFFVVADNADRTIKWLPDKLAVVATGGTIKRRLYYTTNKQVEFPLKAWFAITSRTPQFNREDVADRLLPIRVQRFNGFAALSDLKTEMVRDRNLLLTALVRDVQKVLRGLKKHGGMRHETSFRMADYGQFAHKVSGALGFDDDIEDVLHRLGREQIAFAMRNEPLFEWVERWLAMPGNRGRTHNWRAVCGARAKRSVRADSVEESTGVRSGARGPLVDAGDCLRHHRAARPERHEDHPVWRARWN